MIGISRITEKEIEDGNSEIPQHDLESDMKYIMHIIKKEVNIYSFCTSLSDLASETSTLSGSFPDSY